MMGTLLILATEAHGEGGFGLNLDIFEANLINLGILVGVLLYFAPKVLGNILNERRAKIAEAIQEAESRAQQAKKALDEQQVKLTQAQESAQRIRQEAQARASAAAEAIAAQSEKDIERMSATAAADLSAEQERAIAQLRQRAASLAMERAESLLRQRFGQDANAQQTLIERSLAQLGGR